MTYDPNNIFAKILRGEIPAHKIYEDDHTLAFMDVFPECGLMPTPSFTGMTWTCR